MIQEGQVVLFRFPQTDQTSGNLRPALVLRKLPGVYNDWLICMISTQLSQIIPQFDEMLTDKDADFQDSGLKQPSLIRICRLAVVNQSVLMGTIGRIDPQRLISIRNKLSNWIK